MPAAAIGAAGITVVAFAIALVPTLPAGTNMRDFIAILDGAYKISQGLVPHVDFALPHGALPLYQAVPVLPLMHRIQPLALYQAIGWLIVLPAVAPIAAAQSDLWRTLAVLAFVAVGSLVPCVLLFNWETELSYYAGYNRLGTVLLFLTVVWALTLVRPSWGQVFVVAYLLFLLLATKITFFVAAVAILVVHGVLTPVMRSVLARACLVLIAVIAAIQLMDGMTLGYLRDIVAMVRVNAGGSAHLAVTTAMHYLPALLATGALILATVPGPIEPVSRSTTHRTLLMRVIATGRSYRLPILLGVTAILAVLVESQNTGGLGFAVLVAFCIGRLPARQFTLAASVALAVTATLPWLSNAAFLGMSVATAQIVRAVKDPAIERLIPRTTVAPMSEAIADDYTTIWQAEADPDRPLRLGMAWLKVAQLRDSALFVAQAHLIDEAIDVAEQRHLIARSQRTMTIGDVDYFTRVLGSRSAEGIALWQNPRTFVRPPIDVLRAYLRGVDVAFAPHCGLSDDDFYVVESFIPALEVDFAREPLTRCWDVWHRRSLP